VHRGGRGDILSQKTKKNERGGSVEEEKEKKKNMRGEDIFPKS